MCVCVICAWCVSVHEVCGVWYGLIVYNSMVYMLWCVVWSICCGMVCGMVCDEKSMLACIMGLHQSRNTQDYLFWLSMDSLPWTARTLHSALYTLLAHQSMQFVNKERYISSVYFHTSVSNTDRQLSLVYISSGIIQFLVDMYDKCNPSCKPATSWQVQHIFSHELHVQVSITATFPVHSPSFFIFFKPLPTFFQLWLMQFYVWAHGIK